MTQAVADLARVLGARHSDDTPVFSLDDLMSVVPLVARAADVDDPAVRALLAAFAQHVGFAPDAPDRQQHLDTWRAAHPPSTALLTALRHHLQEAKREGGTDGVRAAAAALFGGVTSRPAASSRPGNWLAVRAGGPSARKR
jgi:hypothetical protein